jgi:hypothetical protein
MAVAIPLWVLGVVGLWPWVGLAVVLGLLGEAHCAVGRSREDPPS